jgi:hypothetical protein
MWVGWGKCIVLTDNDSVYSVRTDDRWCIGHGVLAAREYMQEHRPHDGYETWMECFVHPDDDGEDRQLPRYTIESDFVSGYDAMPVMTAGGTLVESAWDEPSLSAEDIRRILGSMSAPRYRTWNDIGD